MSVPTPEEFLTTYDQPDEPEEIELEPLESIAQSLRRIAAASGSPASPAVPEEVGKVPGYAYDELLAERDDWEDKHRVLFDLVESIGAIVKPSTSKVSLEVKAAIDQWRAPMVPAEEPETVAAVDPDEEGIPAHDAPVEEWREFARSRGYDGPAVADYNRSQIRTMLGIPHSEAAAS